MEKVNEDASSETNADKGKSDSFSDLLCGWVSVTDEMPAIGETVLLFANNVVQKETFVLDAADVSDYAPPDYFWARDELEECPSVKPGQYWQRLPEPPAT